MPSRRLGQYELQYQLGAPSGMGSVYVAIDSDLNREVAIKELLPHLSVDQDFAARFHAEAENLARLNHPNITTLYSLGHEGESEFMVMELIRGHTLKEIMSKVHLNVQECLAIIAQAAAGLSYAHRMGVIHRDIKPSNIMIANDGQLKIMDFGISRVRGSQRQTRDGGIVGTLLYISPEQLRSAEGDERSDIYSLAVSLYEMLTRHPPFRADNEYELMRLHLETPPEPVSSLLPTIDPVIDTALQRALAKDPEDRFAYIDEFSRAIGATALLGDAAAILRRCVAKVYDAEATIIYNPQPTKGAGTGQRSITRSVLSATSEQSAVQAPQPPAPAAKPRKGWLWPATIITAILSIGGVGVGYVLLSPQPVTITEDNRPASITQNGSIEQPRSDAARLPPPPPQTAAIPAPPIMPEPPRVTAPDRPHVVKLAPTPPQPVPMLQTPGGSPVATQTPTPPPGVSAPLQPPIATPIPDPPQPVPAPQPPVVPPAAMQTPAPRQPAPQLPARPPIANQVPDPAQSVPAPRPPTTQAIAGPPPDSRTVNPAPQLAVPQSAPVGPPAAVQAPDASQPAPMPQLAMRPPFGNATLEPQKVEPAPALSVPALSAPAKITNPNETPAVEGLVSAAAGTHAIMIGGRFITLYGIEPNSPSPPQFERDRLAFEKLVRGTVATCYQRQQNRFQCTGQNGDDLSILALKAGIVRPSQNAPPEYRSAR